MKARVAELDATLAAWRNSPRTADDDELLAAWLEDAIERTMPGGDGELPPAPGFGPVTTAIETPPAAELPPASPDVEAQANDTPPEVAPQLGDSEVDAIPSVKGLEHSVVLPTPVALLDSPVETPASNDLTPIPIAESVNGDEAAPSVAVNLTELNARIEGYHQGLGDVEAAVIAGGRPSPMELETLVTRLEDLNEQYQFLSLYYDALTGQERQRVTAPRSPVDAVALLSPFVIEPGDGSDFLADFAAPSGDEPTLAERLQAVTDAARGAAVEGR